MTPQLHGTKLRGDCHCHHDEYTCLSLPHHRTGHNGTDARSCYHGHCQVLRQYDPTQHTTPTYLIENQSGFACVFTATQLDT